MPNRLKSKPSKANNFLQMTKNKQNTDKIHEGQTLWAWLVTNRKPMTYTAEKMGMTRQNLEYHLKKEQLSRDFMETFEKAFKIDLSEILYPISQMHSIKQSESLTYTREKQPNDNNNLTKKIKYSQTLDNDNSLQLTLNPPREKTIKLLNNDYEINLDSFSATLPTRSDTNGWLPVIADVESLMDLQEAIDKGDKRPNGWPMSAIELVRDPNTKGQYRLQAPPYDNFYPLIRAGKWISVSYVDKYKYKTSVIYLVAFKDKSFMLYYLAQGSTKDKVLLISENTKFGQREYDIEDIHSIYAVSPEI